MAVLYSRDYSNLTKEEIEEERRVLYVAMTRAKEELYLLYTEKRGGRDIPPSRFLRELI